jgi:DNA-binding response OmpR family regulator
VSEASTVADAVRALDDQPHWILLDLMLPDGSGLELLRLVRAQRRSCKVCIVTGCDGEVLAHARRAGAEHTFTKPLDPQRLIAVLTAYRVS